MKTTLRIIGFFLCLIGLNQNSFAQCSTANYAALPYTQNFESWITLCDNVSGDSLNEPDSSWINIPSDGNDSWRRDDQGSMAGWNGSGAGTRGFVVPAPFGTTYSAAFNAYDGSPGSTGALDLYIDCSTVTGTKLLSFYYLNAEGFGDDSMNVYISTDGGTTFGPSVLTCPGGITTWTNFTVPISSNSSTVVISFVGTADDGGNDMYLDYVQVLPPCNGKPTAGTISSAAACPGIGDLITLSGTTSAAGLSYSWQQSSDNINWSTLAGETSSSLSVLPAGNTYYRAILTCTTSGLSDTSASVNEAAIESFYRSIPYTEKFDAWMNRCDSLDVPDTGWTNTPTSGDDSWRRNDQGSTAGWSSTYGTSNYISPTPSGSNFSAAFDAYSANSGSKGALNLYINCSSFTGSKLLSFYYLNPEPLGDDYMTVSVSTDGGATSSQILTCPGGTTTWTNYTALINSNSPTTVISFVGTSDGGSNDMWLSEVQIFGPCQNKPVAGNVVVQQGVSSCTSINETLQLSGNTPASGLSYIWQQSSDGINWSSIAGDTANSASVIPFDSTYYRAIVICNSSGLSDTTPGIKSGGFGSFYRTMPYTENFGSWFNRCDSLDVPDTGWINNPATGSDSWRRDDQGGAAGWCSTCGTSNYVTPTPSGSTYSAAFYAYGAQSGTTGALNLYINCSPAGTKQLSFYYLNPEPVGQDYMNVYVSTDGGATFSPSIITCPGGTTSWTKFTMPINSNAATTVISFVGTSDDGSNDMWLDSVYMHILPDCQGKPFAGSINVSNPCSSPGSLMLSGNTSASDLVYTWQQSSDSNTWITMTGDTLSGVDNVSFPQTAYYRAIVTCKVSGLSDTAYTYVVNPGFIAPSFYRAVPYTEDFNSWINRCNTFDVPDTGWTNNPATGEDSWRRDDQGGTADWGCPSCGFNNYITPTPSGSIYSAAFNSYYTPSGTTGTLSLYLNCSTTSGKNLLSFYYLNPETRGRDSMNVYVSTDGGNTFSPSLITCPGSTGSWTYFTVPINSSSATTVISFVGIAQIYGNNMWLDDVQVQPDCDEKPTAGSIVPDGCASNPYTLILSGNTSGALLSYTWQQSGDDVNWTTLTGDNADSIILTDTTSPSYYRAIETCTAVGISDTTASYHSGNISSFFRKLPYTENFASWMNRCSILDVPDTGWINTPSYGDDSWRRNDQGGSDAGWGSPTTGTIYPSAAPGYTYSARFHSSWATVNTTGALDLYVNCNTPTDRQQLNFWYNNTTGLDSVYIMLSTDGGTTFNNIYALSTTPNGWSHDSLVFISNSATTVLRFLAVSDNGTSDIGLDGVEVKTIPLCTGKPSAGTVTENGITCPGLGVSLTLVGNTSIIAEDGLSFAWQQSPDNATWTTIAGDTSSTAPVFPYNPTYYRAIETCKYSGLSDTSAGLQVNGFKSFFRSIPYQESFEQWMSRCDSLDVPDTGWINNPSTGNDSWRRNDQGLSATWGIYANVQGQVQYIQTPFGNYCAAFNAYGAPNGTTGTLSLYINCGTITGNKLLSFYFLNPLYSVGYAAPDSLNIYMSTDGGLTFGAPILSCTGSVFDWTNYTVPIVSNSDETVIKFVAALGSNNGENTDMWLDNVQVLPPCEGKPVAGTLSYQQLCYADTLYLTGSSQANGLIYTWQQSSDNINWSTLTEYTSIDMVIVPTGTTYYRTIVTCTGSGLSDTTTAVKILDAQPIYRPIPYTEDFEKWINNCNIDDIPDTGWINTPSSGNNSWRRDDEGITAIWSDPSGPYSGLYSPASYSGIYSARFHNTSCYAGMTELGDVNDSGALCLYLNCSTIPGTKKLSFYYNDEGSPGNSSYNYAYMNVFLSTDGGKTFSYIDTCGWNGAWANYTALLNTNSPTTVVKFLGVAAGSQQYDLGLDLVQIIAPCQDKPSAGTISKVVSCLQPSLDSLIVTGSSAVATLSYAWQQSADGSTWSTLPGDTAMGIDGTPPNYYRVIVTCPNSGLSDTTPAYHLNSNTFYRTIPYIQNFASWMDRCANLDVPDTGWVNYPPTGQSSWRRDDQGGTADWGCPSCTAGITAAPGCTYSALNDDDEGDTGTSYLSLYVNCSPAGAKQLNFYYINSDRLGNNDGDFPDTMNVFMSTDGGTTYSLLLTCPATITSWTQYSVPLPTNSATTVIKFVSDGNGSGALAIDNVEVLLRTPCDGKPVAGTATTNYNTLCGSNTAIIQLNGENLGTYVWQTSTDSVNWTNLADTTTTLTTPQLTAIKNYFRSIITCPSSGLTDTSNVILIYYFPNCYCPPQSTNEDGDNIGNITINFDSKTILNEGVDTPAINSNLVGQYYIDYVDTPGVVLNLEQGYTYNISSAIVTTAGGGNYADTAYAFIDYNQDGMWEASERIWSAAYNMPFTSTPVPTSGTFTVPLNADTGYTEMRFQLSYQSPVPTPCYNSNNEPGETEDFLVHISALSGCGGTPTAGNAVPATDTLCPNASIILNVENTSVATGLTFQWQSSPDSSTWTNIPGAVSSQFIDTGILTSTYYQCQVTCSNSDLSAYSTASYIYIDNLSNETVTTNNTSICGPGTATLTAAGGTGNYYWSTPSGIDSLPVSTSAIFSPYVTSSTTYYVSCGISPTDYCVTGYDTIAANYFKYPGASTYGTNGNYHPADTGLAGLVFNVQTGFTLTGVYIFPQFAGSFHVYLLNDSGKILNTALATVTAPTPNKPYWVPLDFNVTAGIGYELVAKVSEVNSMADIDTRATGTAFPFTNCNNSITITGGTKDGVQDTDYYFFYKWVIHSGCETQRIPASITVTPPPALTVSVSPLDYSCNGVPFSGTLTANGSGYTSFNWSPQTGLGSPFGQTTPCTTDSTTTYTVNATNGTCYNVATVTVTVEPPIVITQTVSSNYICVGVPVQINSTVSFLQSASIYCIPSLPGNCNEYLSALNFDNVSITNSTCIGYTNHADTAQVVAGTGYTISLTPSQNTNSYGFGVWIDYNHNGVFTDSSELAFVVASQPFSGSQKETGTITIPQNALHGYTRMRIINFLNNTPGLNAANCDIGTLFANNQTIIGSIDDITIDVTNNNPLTYIWSPTAGLSDTATFNPIATPTTTTTYSLVVTNSGECSDTAATTIYVYSAPTVNIYAPDDTLCIGTSEILDAGAGFVSYLWNNGDTTEQTTITSAGKYSVQVTGQDGCTGVDTVNIASDTCSGINQVGVGNYSIGVYPNPFNSQFTLELNGLPAATFVFSLTNTLGQKVYEFKDQNITTVYKKNIDLQELPSGMYYISIVLNGKYYVKQIIKTN